MKPILILFAVSLVFFSCESDTDEQVNTLGVSTLGSAVRFSLAEYLDANENNLTFKFLTDKDFPCINYQIAQHMERAGKQITISLEEIQKADVCLEASGPATAFIDLENLTEGNYDLTINIGEFISSKGKLLVTDKAYQLKMEASEGLIVERHILHRIPDHVIWGTIRYADRLRAKGLYHMLMTSLQGAGASEKRLPEGDYYYFDVDAGGRLRTGNAGQEPEDTFILEFNGSNEQIQTILRQVEQVYGEDAMVRIYNAVGDEFKTTSF